MPHNKFAICNCYINCTMNMISKCCCNLFPHVFITSVDVTFNKLYTKQPKFSLCGRSVRNYVFSSQELCF